MVCPSCRRPADQSGNSIQSHKFGHQRMCGIAGLVDLAGMDANEAAARSLSALGAIRARGPDGGGAWSDRHCALVHTRLAIIELLPLGAQPMVRDGLVITFN